VSGPEQAIDQFPAGFRPAHLEREKASFHDCEMLPAFGHKACYQFVVESRHYFSL
jgi:hypothetical protein